MKKIGITGITGTIGKVLEAHLSETYTITAFRRSDINLSDVDEVLQKVKDLDVLIHLAWSREIGFNNELMDIHDLSMIYNMYHAAKTNKIPRIIMASSIHADTYTYWIGPIKKDPYSIPYPDSPYGAGKVYMEALGRYYATQGIEVVCVRFGGVNDDDNRNYPEEGYKKIYLSHKDMIELIVKIIDNDEIPGNYQLVYAVSNNSTGIHDWKNVFGWIPTSFE